jgi:membrane-associated phospholipid phosphatase
MLHKIALLTSGLCLLVSPHSVRAQSPYTLDPTREWALFGTGMVLGLGGLFMTTHVEPLTLDEINRLDVNDINGFDRGSMQPFRDDHAGDAVALASYLVPLTFLARDDTREDFKTLGTMWVEATLLDLGIDGIVKAAVARTRPYAYDPDAPLDKKTDRTARLSFYSGHTTSTATNCFFAARVFSDYLTDDTAEVLLWTGAALYPALSGFLRVDSGHHFTTDVIAGYVIGASIGLLVPAVHRHQDDRLSLQPSSGGVNMGISFQLTF